MLQIKYSSRDENAVSHAIEEKSDYANEHPSSKM